MGLTRFGRSTARHPASSLWVHFVHLIVLDRGAAIVFRSLPFQLASLFVNIRYLKRTFRWHWFVRDCDLYGDGIPSRGIGGCDTVIAAVVARHGTNAEFGAIIGIVYLHFPIGMQRNSSVSPLDVWWRLADHISIESQ